LQDNPEDREDVEWFLNLDKEPLHEQSGEIDAKT
jgi:hypothetical protein